MLKEITFELFESLDDKVIDSDWLSFRGEIATELARTHLFPSFAREFKQRLSDSARDFVKQKMAKALWSYASKSPFKVSCTKDQLFLHSQKRKATRRESLLLVSCVSCVRVSLFEIQIMQMETD